jgi:hypothetical protein
MLTHPHELCVYIRAFPIGAMPPRFLAASYMALLGDHSRSSAPAQPHQAHSTMQ